MNIPPEPVVARNNTAAVVRNKPVVADETALHYFRTATTETLATLLRRGAISFSSVSRFSTISGKPDPREADQEHCPGGGFKSVAVGPALREALTSGL